MDNWFTIDKLDHETYIISEYRHWEETHCYLLNGSEKSLLIDTGLGIANIYDEVQKLTDRPTAAAGAPFIGYTARDLNPHDRSFPTAEGRRDALPRQRHI